MHRAVLSLRVSVSVVLAVLLIWQLGLVATGSKTELANYWFNAGYATIFLLAATLGFIAHRRRFIKGVQGKALTLFSCGSLSFATALAIWAYAGIVQGVSTPFPSYADIFFTLYTLFVGMACISLLQLLKPILTRRTIVQSATIALAVFVLVLIFLIIPTLTSDTDPIVRLLTITYPTIACMLMTLVLIVARSSGGTMAHSVKFYFISLTFLAAGLVSFLIRHNTGSYWNGDISDFFCLIAGYSAALAAIEIGWNEA